jgi:hypothetical protein
MESLSLLNDIRQNYTRIIEINPNSTFQKNKKIENKMIRRGGKTELFENSNFNVPINLQTDAQIKLQPIAVVPIVNIPVISKIQSPKIPTSTTPMRSYTYEELTAKGMLKPNLQEILKAKGLKVSGNKDVLIERILQSQT